MTVRENLIAAKALIADEAVYLNAYRTTGSAIAWAMDEATCCDDQAVSAMFAAMAPYWQASRGEHAVVMAVFDRAIAAQDDTQ